MPEEGATELSDGVTDEAQRESLSEVLSLFAASSLRSSVFGASVAAATLGSGSLGPTSTRLCEHTRALDDSLRSHSSLGTGVLGYGHTGRPRSCSH